MESPISGLLADTKMKHFAAQVFEEYRRRLWIRYVDDTYVVLPAAKIEQSHDDPNKVISRMAFTHEEEN
ncbi:unnamed protein product [Echinostoma caproni]|uniref:Reverse transcriptase domain-containing protein n=1 Tax=Echinostoma caproni TaxID=27848 RepID=A0A183AQ78_9TREM|nr:unnamed protein product [Echinostoma caproni]